MKKVKQMTVMLLTVILVVIAGCSSGQPPKEALQAAMTKISEADSYAINMSFGLNELEIAPEALEADAAQAAAIIGMIKDAKVTVDAVYQKEPLRTDMNMEIVIPGDMEMTLKVPMIMTEETLYVKIPQIPMLPLPETVTGKFIKLDLKELAAMQGSEAEIDVEAQQKLGKELAEVFLKNFDEKTYFSEPKAEDAGLPEGLEAEQIVSFEINEGNYAKTVETIVNQVLPEFIDVLLKNEDSLKSLQLEKADIEKFKTDLETNKAEVLDVLKNNVKVNTLKLTGAIKDGYLVYQNGQVNVEATEKESGQSMKIGLDFDATYSEINKAPTFQEIPTDAITLEQLMQLFGAPTGL